MSPPLTCIAGTTQAFTRRTVLRKAVLGPWDPSVSSMWLYCLADAARKHDMLVHHTTLVLTHHHTMVTPTRPGTRGPFFEQLHQPMSRGLNALLKVRGYDKLHQVWDNRQTHRLRLLDAEAMMLQLIYHQLQHVDAGLVHKPEQMPGFTFRWSLWREGAFLTVDVPKVHFDSSKREPLRLKFTPPPALLALFDGDVDKLIFTMEKLERLELAKRRRRRRLLGLRVKGAQAIRRIHPWDEPDSQREASGSRIPTFRIGSRVNRKQKHARAAKEVRAFRKAHREAFSAWRQGESVAFPFGTDKMVHLYGAEAKAAPLSDAWLVAPDAHWNSSVDTASDPPSINQVMSTVKSSLESEGEPQAYVQPQNRRTRKLGSPANTSSPSNDDKPIGRIVVRRTRKTWSPKPPGTPKTRTPKPPDDSPTR